MCININDLANAMRRAATIRPTLIIAIILILSARPVPSSASPLCQRGGTTRSPVTAQQTTPGDQQTEPGKPDDSREKILDDQLRLAEQYRLLEEKLFSLYQYEQDQNPDRSELLQRAYQQSKQRLTIQRLNTAVRNLQEARLREANQNQQLVLKELNELLDLLQSEDRSKRVKDDIDRYQRYLKEVNRLLRIQQGIRGQAENGESGERLNNAQKSNADRTRKLADEVKQNEESTDDNKDSDSSGNEPGQNNKDSLPDNSSPQKDKPTPGDNSGSKSGDKSKDQQPSQPPSGQPGQQPPDSSSPSESAPNPDQPNQQPPNPVRQRLQNAEDKMRQAQEKLDQAKREESVEDMNAAERELAEAKQELEEILRQLREEEIERMLASLESRFRKMLERQVKIYDKTKTLSKIANANRRADFEMQSGKLAVDEKTLVTEAGRALLLLQDDGSSIAIPETVHQMQLDMQQTADRLSAGKVDTITLEIEEDIIDTLTYLVEAFTNAQEQQQKGEQSSQNGTPSQPGQQPLVDQLAELKLIRGLQQRIHRRHQRFAELLDNPHDPIGLTRDPDLKQALIDLSGRQRQVEQITRDIVVGKNK